MLRIEGGRRDGRRGANLLEMALVTFLLIVLLVGIVDLGRVFYTYIIITNAAREGARYASRFAHHADGILNATKTEAAAGGVALQDSNIDIDPDPDGTPAEPGEPITVTVNSDVDTMFGSIIGFDTVPLRGRAEMVVFWKSDD
jgi:Flp pilus assembly protein TadG